MESDQDDKVVSLEREVATLRQRVAELQRRQALYKDSEASKRVGGVEVSVSAREMLLVEAERIAHVGSWVWDVGTNLVFWSDELYRIMGYDPGTDAASTEAFFAGVHPEDRERVRTQSASGIASGISQQVDYRVLRPDGTIRQVSMNGTLIFDGEGKLRRVVGTVHDLTEERVARQKIQKAHELLEEAQALSHMGNWNYDIVTGKREWSAELRRIVGIGEGVAATEEAFVSLIHPEDRGRVTEARNLYLGPSAPDAVEFRVMRPSGEIRHVRVQAMVQRGEDGVAVQLRGTCLDVTEQVRLRQQLAEAHKIEAIGRLAGGIAHDFNNLLTIVTLNLDMWARNQPTAVPEIEDAQRAISSARSLVQRLLTLSRKAKLDRRFVDPNELVTQTLAMLRRVVGDEIHLTTDLAASAPTVHVDPAQIEQALVNLVVNARDAMLDGGNVIVSTRVLTAEDGGATVEIAVRDDGPGMPPEVLQHIFEPFFTTKAEGRGTGLGLSTVLGTVEQHGGGVSVDSAPGRGTTFRIRLPVKEGPRSTSMFPRAPVPASAHLPAATILVVEDEPMVASVIARVLERHGLTVLLAARASEAFTLWDEHPEIDAVLCDVSMPEMKGPDLLKALRKRNRPLRALFVTGYSDEKVADSRYPVLSKPFLPDELIKAVSRLLDDERR